MWLAGEHIYMIILGCALDARKGIQGVKGLIASINFK